MKTHPYILAQQIKKAREKNNLTQNELAERLHKTLRTIQKYESGEIDISMSTLYEIADELHVSIAYLLNIETKPVLHTVSDLLSYVTELLDKEDLDVRIETSHPIPDGKFECSIVFNGDNPDSSLTYSLCHILNSIRSERNAFEYYAKDYSTYRQRIDNLIILKDQELHDKQYEDLSPEESERRWQEAKDARDNARSSGLDPYEATKDMTRSARAHKSNPGRKEE